MSLGYSRARMQLPIGQILCLLVDNPTRQSAVCAVDIPLLKYCLEQCLAHFVMAMGFWWDLGGEGVCRNRRIHVLKLQVCNWWFLGIEPVRGVVQCLLIGGALKRDASSVRLCPALPKGRRCHKERLGTGSSFLNFIQLTSTTPFNHMSSSRTKSSSFL
jgi:hypothetical protein